MTELPDNTPVIIGVGFSVYRDDDPLACPEPWQLMAEAVGRAAADAGDSSLAARIESISVEQGMWQYRNPGKLVADAVGCPGAKSILADLGVLQLTPLFDLFESIVQGEVDLGVVTGGEAKYRELRASIAGIELPVTTEQADVANPDVYHPTPDPFATEAESKAGIMMPVEMFAVIESALRHSEGLDIETHRDQLAELYSGFSHIAAENPHAWSREPLPPEAIRDEVGKNKMLAFPYTKKHNSQWNVNQGTAILVCSLAKAREWGLDESRFIFPVTAVQSRHVVCLAEQQSLYSHPGTVLAGQRAYELAGITAADVTAADLYSCFPAAVRSFAKDLQLEGVCPFTVTGSMAFSGGPYNHGALDGVARMTEVLRESEAASYGLTTNLSGIFGKQAVAIFSNTAGDNAYRYEDITEAVAAVDLPKPSTPDYIGDGHIVGYTVVYQGGAPSHALAYIDTIDGRRTVARSEDQAVMARLIEKEFVGAAVKVAEPQRFELVA